MEDMIAFILGCYLVAASVVAPIFAISMAWEARDCALFSGEPCQWYLMPDSKVDADIWGGPRK